MKILVLFVLLFSSLIADNFKNITLSDFTAIVADNSRFNIVVSSNIDKTISLSLPVLNFKDKKITFDLLKNILKYNNLAYSVSLNTVYIYDPLALSKKKVVIDNFIIRYNNLSKSDIDSFFKKLFPDIKYFISRGRILLISDFKTFKKIQTQILSLDKSFYSSVVNVVVLSTNQDKLKNAGLDFSILKFNPSYYLSILTSTVNMPSTLDSRFQFYSLLHLLQSKDISKILTSPQITLLDNKPSLLESTTNIPFLTSTTSTKDNITTTQNSYSYKDVGLKMYFTNVSVSKNSVQFDLEIFVQNILDTSLTPKTTSKHIKTHCNLSKNSLFLLGGLNQTTTQNTIANVPIIEYVPIINKITEHTTVTNRKEVFSIVLSIKSLSKMRF